MSNVCIPCSMGFSDLVAKKHLKGVAAGVAVVFGDSLAKYQAPRDTTCLLRESLRVRRHQTCAYVVTVA